MLFQYLVAYIHPIIINSKMINTPIVNDSTCLIFWSSVSLLDCITSARLLFSLSSSKNKAPFLESTLHRSIRVAVFPSSSSQKISAKGRSANRSSVIARAESHPIYLNNWQIFDVLTPLVPASKLFGFIGDGKRVSLFGLPPQEI